MPPTIADRARSPAVRVVAGTALPVTTLVLAVLALAAVCLASLAVGANPISPARVWAGLLGQEQEAMDIVRGGRLPRTLLGLLVGSALGAAGAVMQSLARNPLADPALLGVNGERRPRW